MTHKLRTAILLTALALAAAPLALAAEQAPIASPSTTTPSGQGEVLNNASIIELQKLGLGEGVILQKIKGSRCAFDVSVDGLKQLKAAAVPDSVIGAMLSANSASTGNAAPPEPPVDANNPQSPHEAGIWLYEEPSAKPKMTQLEPSVYSQTKTGSGMLSQFGVTQKRLAVIRSAHAEIETANRRPTFYFYFERTQAGLSDARNSATSPNEYVLAQFEVIEKDNQRRLLMGQMNAYSGSVTGPEDRAVRSFGFQKLAPGSYKVTPKDDLASGEYGFFYGGNSGGGRVFDFRVKGSPETEPAPPVPDNQNTKKTR